MEDLSMKKVSSWNIKEIIAIGATGAALLLYNYLACLGEEQ